MKLPAILFLATLLPGLLPACKVPVFRYALERWSADPFRLLVADQGPLPPDLQSELITLRDSLRTNPLPVNLTLEVVDLTLLTELQQISLPGLEHLGTGPSMVLLPPPSWKSERPVWTGPATTGNLAALLDSPARQRCAAHLLSGESAVWILVPSGQPDRDQQAATLLAEGLHLATTTLKIPAGVIRRDDLNRDLPRIDLDDILRSDLPLKISFATETISRSDPAEALFLAILLGPSPPATSEPLLVPVFGRGRTPGPLPVSRLTANRILEACRYLCGSCSCQAKSGNPGYDLLFRTAWDKLLHATVLTARSPLVQDALDTVTFGNDQPGPEIDPTRESNRPRILPVVISTGAAILLFFASLVWILTKERRRRANPV